MADHATLGHFLPFLLRRRLQAVLWPDKSGTTRAITVVLLVLAMAYGAGFGLFLNASYLEGVATYLPIMLTGFYAGLLTTALLVDFMPTLRPVTRPLPEHFPVSARQNVVTAFLLDLITLRRITIMAGLLVALGVAPGHASVPGFGLLLLLGAAVLSFNARLLVSMRRWRHPLLLGHALSLALMLWWLAYPEARYTTALGVGMSLLPWLLWAAQLRWVAPQFSARFLPTETEAATGIAQTRLPLEWKVYRSKAWKAMLTGMLMKTGMLVVTALVFVKGTKLTTQGFFYFTFLPVIGFTYANNNLFGFMKSMVANEMLRLGLTRRVLLLYLRLVGPVVLIDCLVSAVALLGLYPASYWPLLWLLPLCAAALMSLGLWGSLYQAQPVAETVEFGNMRKNTSTLMSLLTIAVALSLYFLPWWWARIALAALVAGSAWWPIRQALRNDGALRRRLWHGLHA
ncbi:hypothetical protein ACFQT0_00795 [Hymenobacter humi]|uniref:Uncharacterized protein n=1 Tax=Hymenobacter humi TaxID=1411620 RepID=A0ABW2TY29_9BACT